MDREAIERAVRNCYSTWSRRYRAEYYDADKAYPPVHIGIVQDLLRGAKSCTLIDAGCGPASMLCDLSLPGLERFGFDLTPSMVEEARTILGRQGVPQANLWEGSVLDARSFSPPAGPMTFDAAICFGVLPHVAQESDRVVLKNMYDAIRPGGLIAIEARNALFAMFSLNRYSREFFHDVLIDEAGLRDRSGPDRAALDQALTQLDERFRVDLPPKRAGYQGEPGYDEVQSRTHIPMQLRSDAEGVGFVNVSLLFYHYHALPPMFEDRLPGLFRRESVAMENPTDWRGYVMASAFVLVAERPAAK